MTNEGQVNRNGSREILASLCESKLSPEKLLESNQFSSTCDAMKAAIQLYSSGKANLFEYLSNSSYRNRNSSDDVIKDTHFCLNPTIKSNIVPIFDNGKLTKA